MVRFSAIGWDHRHVYDLTAALMVAAALCAGYDPRATDQRAMSGFRKRVRYVPQVRRQRLSDDPSIGSIVLCAARPRYFHWALTF